MTARGANDFEIKNGILQGYSEPFLPKYQTYGQVILDSLKSNPDFVGQIDGVTGRRERFGEMLKKSVKCAFWLRKQKIGRGDVIGICTHNQMDMYVPILASLFVGAVFNPWWESGQTREMVRHFVTLTKPKILFIHESSLSTVLGVIEEMGVNMKLVTFGKTSDLESLDEILFSMDEKNVNSFEIENSKSLEDAAFIVYTSGTTGLPKGIVNSHKSIFGNSPNFLEIGKLNENVRSINFSSISWGVGIACLFRSLVAPETRIVYPDFDTEKTLRLIDKFKINLMHLSPRKAFKLLKISAASNYDVSSLKLFWISGGVMKSKMQEAIAARFSKAKVFQAYGTSELGGVAFRQLSGFTPNSCGTIVRNIRMKVVDRKNGKILGPRETGEALFKSPFMMSGYLDNPEATKKAIDSDGWLHSGDLVHYDEKGQVFVTDRVSEMINYRGNFISPESIEQSMYIHPAIFDIAVVSIPHNEDGERPIAFVSETPGIKVKEVELEEIMAESLPDGKEISGSVQFLDKIPRLLSGKVARAELKKLAMSSATNVKNFSEE